ncbi:hypothetical protein ACFFRR_011434 [Megaselia abdita]
MNKILLFFVLSVSLLQIRASEIRLDIRHLPNSYIKDAFVTEINKFSEEDRRIDVCKEQLFTIVNNLQSPNPKTFFHSFEVFDSWGKIPSGITYGHLMDLGNYQQCIHIDFNTASALTGTETNISGKYCQAKIPIDEIIKLVKTRNALLDSYTRGHVEGPAMDPPMGIGIGICIPKVCNKKKIASILTNALNGVKVSVNNCGTIEKPDFEAIDYVAACVFGVIGLLLILSTFYDLYTEKLNIPRNESFLAFSIIHNSHKLFAINTKPNPNSINCLHGIRSLSMVWVIYGHAIVWYLLFPILNLRTVDDWKRTPFALALETGVISVDTFFFISGLLVAWIGLKELQKNNGRINVIMMYVHRLFRLIPLIGIIILFTLSLLKYCGAGPNWPTFLITQTYPCEKTWWRTLLFIQNYGNDLLCVPQSWYLAVDMQLYLISPLILLGLYKWGKKFIPVLVVASALSIGCVYATYIKYDFTDVLSINDMDNDRSNKTYVVTHTRYTIWLMGVAFGYILTQFKNKEVRIPFLYNMLGWSAAIATVFSVVFGPYNSQQVGYVSTAAEAATYDVFSRVGWGLALSWIIFACHHGYGGVINDFLSHPVWQVISKLSFCMYMSHFLVQIVIYGNVQTSLYFSDFESMGKFWISFGFSIMASIVLVLACEAPVIALEKILFSRNSKKSDKKEMNSQECVENREKV